MDERDEQFLKDVAWSEAWFPWRKTNSILVRGREGNFWEPFAVIVSILALVATAISTFASWRQVGIMSEQLISDQRNSEIQGLLTETLEYCRKMNDSPIVPDLTEAAKDDGMCYYRDAEGKRYTDPCPGKFLMEKTENELRNYYIEINTHIDNINKHSLNLLRIIPKPERYLINRFSEEFATLPNMEDVISSGSAKEAQLLLKSEAPFCFRAYARLYNTLSGEETIDPLIGFDGRMQDSPEDFDFRTFITGNQGVKEVEAEEVRTEKDESDQKP